jgi:hypothetical protein
MAINKIIIQGLCKGPEGRLEQVFHEGSPKISAAIRYSDGYKLDVLQLTANIESSRDVDDLIQLLQIAKYSFHRPKQLKQ